MAFFDQKKSDDEKQSNFKLKLPPLKEKGSGLRTLAIWVIIILVTIYFYRVFLPGVNTEVTIFYSEFREQLTKGNIEKLEVVDKEITGYLRDEAITLQNGKPQKYKVFKVLLLSFNDNNLMELIIENKVELVAREKGFNFMSLFYMWLPWLLFIGIWIFFMRQMQGGQKGIFSFGKSRARLLSPDRAKVTFMDVAGADEAKEELQEVIEFLKEPGKFTKLGGKIPKGALLLGPPGTGKTLLARAVAGEAGVPFFSMSGSDFVEMFVGVGASRVRDLFETGKKNAPCIIFIDEIDAVGRQRGAGLGGGHDEREQTLNQLLVEMDGFESNEGVILIAATNRPDVLDSALLRPGRFDRQIVVDLPDVRGREGILKVHTKNIKLDTNVLLEIIAKGTPGMSGADLANLVNEAALLAARKNRTTVSMTEMEEAKDKVMMGTERRSLTIAPAEKKIIAYHEAGHVLIAKHLPGSDPVHKVTIIPRGRALGVTHSLPTDDRHLYSKNWALNKICQLMGGRLAEELHFQEISSGASNDIEVATKIARMMVCEWGMSPLGPIAFGKKQDEIFLGREIVRHSDYSEATAVKVDQEIHWIIDSCLQKSRHILQDNLQQLNRLSEELLKKEILTGEEIDSIILNKVKPAAGSAPKTTTPSVATKKTTARKIATKEIVEENIPVKPEKGTRTRNKKPIKVDELAEKIIPSAEVKETVVKRQTRQTKNDNSGEMDSAEPQPKPKTKKGKSTPTWNYLKKPEDSEGE